VSHRERVVSAGDAEVLVREWGQEGPPIFFWHALGDHTSLQLVDAAPILVDEYGYRLIGIDAPGFGGSPRLPNERYEIPALIELAGDLLDTLGLEKPVWAGSSWGGIIGVQFAAAHSERLSALVLIDGGYLDPESGHDEVVSTVDPDVYTAAMLGIDRSPPSRAHPRLGETGLPVLLLGATEPPQERARRDAWRERFAAQVPQADVRRMEGAPHLMLEAQPEETAREIGEWLRTLPYA
jgi:pimeloyl-ACP methyl ester carboxylesterase